MAKLMSHASVLRSELDPAERPTASVDRLSLAGLFLYAGAVASLKYTQRADTSRVSRTQHEQAYRRWRTEQLTDQLHSNFDTKFIAGKNVLDFACGTGELSFLLVEHKPDSLVGVDIDETAISKANKAKLHVDTELASSPTFFHQADDLPSPVAANSVDLICCFDAMEHINGIGGVLADWQRMLRPGGRAWIWWSPWRGPFGHHLDSLVPLPWVHLFFAERTIFSACARVYDHPCFVPRKWDIDSSTGQKKPNKWQTTTSFSPFLNRMSRGTFEREVNHAGLQIHRQRTQGFSGSLASRMTRALLPIPMVGDGFVSYYVYELEKPCIERNGH